MLGNFDERYKIQEGTESKDYDGKSWSYSTDETAWGKAVDADSKVRERFQSMDSEITNIIKLNGDLTLSYAQYRLVRVSDSQIFEPTAPPVKRGEYNKATFVGVERNGHAD